LPGCYEFVFVDNSYLTQKFCENNVCEYTNILLLETGVHWDMNILMSIVALVEVSDVICNIIWGSETHFSTSLNSIV